MSDTDSFIDEVSEEVRKERLTGYLRRYGWIGALAVVLIVGGAAFNEVRKANARANAEALGDSLLGALQSDAASDRLSALSEISVEGDAADLVSLLTAAERLAENEPESAAQLLRPLAESPDAPVIYSDLAGLKLVLMGGDVLEPTTRDQLLERLARPGAPYAELAQEQQVLALVADGRAADAIEAAGELLVQAGITPGMRQRLVQLIIALGGELPVPDAG